MPQVFEVLAESYKAGFADAARTVRRMIRAKGQDAAAVEILAMWVDLSDVTGNAELKGYCDGLLASLE
jgi:hypothetical protein